MIDTTQPGDVYLEKMRRRTSYFFLASAILICLISFLGQIVLAVSLLFPLTVFLFYQAGIEGGYKVGAHISQLE